MVEVSPTQVRKENKLITVIGPTASGKTTRAVALARHFDAEIISADSRQVYRGMDIGTGKDLDEYQEIPYHLIDICKAGDKYNLFRFVADFHKSLSKIKEKGKNVVVCGGSGMYIETALSGIILPDVPENKELRNRLAGCSLSELTEILKASKTLHNTTDVDTVKRALRAIEIEEYYKSHPEEAQIARRSLANPLDSLIIGIDIPRDKRRERISRRLKKRLEDGMVKEVENLIESGISAEDLIYYGLEYKFLTLYVTGQISFSRMESELEIAIHQFAKRQMTWFRGMERRGFKIHWLPYDMPQPAFIEYVSNLLVQEACSGT